MGDFNPFHTFEVHALERGVGGVATFCSTIDSVILIRGIDFEFEKLCEFEIISKVNLQFKSRAREGLV
jgi:hypothetical protein